MELTPTQAEIRFEEGRGRAMRAPLTSLCPHTQQDYLEGWRSVRPVEYEVVGIQLGSREVGCVVTVLRQHRLYPNGLIYVQVLNTPAATHVDHITDTMTINRAMLAAYRDVLHGVETPIVINWRVDE